jgi:outer membrane protein assembly factor BamB
VYSSPAVADGKVYVGSDDRNVYCLNASTGAKIWNYILAPVAFSSPAVYDGKVFVELSFATAGFLCLNASTGAFIWSYMTPSPSIPTIYSSSPAVADGKVYGGWGLHVAPGLNVGNVYCLNASTGAQIWNYTTGGWVMSSPAVVSGLVYVGSFDGKVYCLNATDGAYVWNYTTGAAVKSSPAVANGMVYVGSDDGKVYALNAGTGELVWSYNTGNVVESSPAIADGVVYVGSGNDRVYAFGLPLAHIAPASVTLYVGQSQLFTSSVSGGTSPYSYQWYLNGAPVSGATGPSWTFRPTSAGSYTVYVKVTASLGAQAASNTA